MPCDIFLSYTREKDPFVGSLWGKLQDQVRLRAGRSASIFKDTEGIMTGDNWSDVLISEVKSAKIFLFLLSVPWIQSDWCVKEYKLFKESMTPKKKLFPIEWVPVNEAFLSDSQKILNKEIQKLQVRFKWKDLQNRSLESDDVKITIGNMADELADDLAARAII
jgi:hypothetical protein